MVSSGSLPCLPSTDVTEATRTLLQTAQAESAGPEPMKHCGHELLAASLLLVAMPFVPCSFLLLVVGARILVAFKIPGKQTRIGIMLDQDTILTVVEHDSPACVQCPQTNVMKLSN